MEMGVQLMGAAVGGARLKLPARLSWQAPFQSPPAAEPYGVCGHRQPAAHVAELLLPDAAP